MFSSKTITLTTLTTVHIVALFRKLHAAFPGRRFELETKGGIRMIDYAKPQDRLFMFNLPQWPEVSADALFDWDINRVERMLCAGHLRMRATLVGEWKSYELNAIEIAFKSIGAIPNLEPFLKTIYRHPIDEIEFYRDRLGSYLHIGKNLLSIGIKNPTHLLPARIINYARWILSIVYVAQMVKTQLACRFRPIYSEDMYGNSTIDCKTHSIIVAIAVQEIVPYLQFPNETPKYVVVINHRKTHSDYLRLMYQLIHKLIKIPPDEPVKMVKLFL